MYIANKLMVCLKELVVKLMSKYTVILTKIINNVDGAEETMENYQLTP